MYKTVFRGTAVIPQMIFNTGITPYKETLDPNQPPPGNVYAPKRHDDGSLKSAGDIVTDTVVCVTANFRAAPIFPLSGGVDTFIYVAAVEVSKIFQTPRCQYADGMKAIQLGTTPEKALWPLFGEELAVVRIPAGQIMAAIKVKRDEPNDWKAGINYELVDYSVNAFCTLPVDYIEFVRNCLTEEWKQHRTGITPKVTAGYVKCAWQPKPGANP